MLTRYLLNILFQIHQILYHYQICDLWAFKKIGWWYEVEIILVGVQKVDPRAQKDALGSQDSNPGAWKGDPGA